MNVLFVNKVSPELGGGAEARILEVGKRLVKRGCNVYVLCATTDPSLRGSKNIDGINITFIKTCPKFILKSDTLGFHASRIFFYLSPLKKLENIIAQNKIDVIIEDVSPTLNPWISKIAKRYNVPLIFSIHEVFENISTWTQFYGFYGLWGYIFEKKIRERKINYQRIITVAKWVWSSLARDIPECLIDVIPNGVDLDKFKPIKKTKNDIIRMLNVGRFVSHKGHIYLLKAIKILLSYRSDFILHLVGTGPLLPQMKKISDEIGINKNVVFHGYVADDKLLELYSRSDIFILPSIIEGLPVVILEAMAMGLPIVSTRIAAINGILDENNAIMVEPANPLSLANGIMKIINNERLRERLSRIVRNEAVERFDWEKISDINFSSLSEVIICTHTK